MLVVDRHKLTVFYLKSFDMDSVQVGKAVFDKEIHTTLGIEARTFSYPGRYGNKKKCVYTFLLVSADVCSHMYIPVV